MMNSKKVIESEANHKMSLRLRQLGNDWLIDVSDECWKVPGNELRKVVDVLVTMKTKYRPRIGGKT